MSLSERLNKPRNGTLFIISAPSGAGKTSLVNALIEKTAHIKVSISYTTRQMRSGEVNGVNYHFVSRDEFINMIQQGDFIEHAEVFGNYYGTSQRWIEAQLETGDDLILEIDWQGAQQVRHLMPGAVWIFILPPDRQTLAERLKKRGQDDAKTIAERMSQAISEMSHCAESDYIVINDDFDKAVVDLQSIVRCQRLRQPRQTRLNQQLIADLLS